MPFSNLSFGAAVVYILLIILLFKIIKTPLKWAFKLLINAVSGFVALVILNFFGSIVGLTLTINLVNSLIAGILGLPGVILLLILEHMV